MSKRLAFFCLTLGLVISGFYHLAAADPKLPMSLLPPAPPGYLLVDEDMWSQLMDEAGRHLERARDGFLHGHARTAALELKKAAIMMRIDAAHGEDRADLALLKSAAELDHLSHSLQNPQNTHSVEDLDAISSRALAALAEHEQLKAENAWKHGHTRRSGRYLRAAADNLERAAFQARVGVSTATSDAVKDARILSGRLIDGTGQMMDDVGRGIHALGHRIQHFSHDLVRPIQERRN